MDKSNPQGQQINRISQLKRLIKGAAKGDEQQLRRLVAPFLTEGETLIDCAFTAKFGLIPAYDFAFLTDRRIGDIEITPLTGNLRVEVAFLHKVDAMILFQPAFPILLRLGMLVLYLIVPFFAIPLALTANSLLAIAIAAVVIFLANLVVSSVINPIIKRTFLRFKKSGLWLKLTGTFVGTLIFSDRDRFAIVSRFARQLSDLKRQLDREAA